MTGSGSAAARLRDLVLALPRLERNANYVDVPAARTCARQAALNALAVAADAVGDLDRVRIVQMLVFVASTPELGEQSRVADAASELLVQVLGENGRHARTAIGVAGLPRNSPVEVQLVCTASQPTERGEP
ncbi:RidA family protein [Streptomyces sp. MN03-5084-2B]|nr:RidA family protein [Streptomyces sp. MN03-5084-2B]